MKINLFTSFYPEKHKERAQELLTCLYKNSINPAIDKVILLNNPRPTYQNFFRETEKYPDDINIIANTDIYFDPSISILKEVFGEQFRNYFQKHEAKNICFALTRWDADRTGSVSRFVDRGSQDAWVFMGTVNNAAKMDASYFMGTPGCDNRIAHELADAGYAVFNPSEDIKAIHIHNSGIRNYRIKDTVCGEHLLIDATGLKNAEKDGKVYYKIFHKSEINSNESDLPKPIQNKEITDTSTGNTPEIAVTYEPVKVMHIALSPGNNGLPRALKKLGPYTEVDWGTIRKEQGEKRMNEIILETHNNFKPDLVFMQLQTDDIFYPETARKISESSFFLHWGGDKRDSLSRYYTELAEHVSITCCTCEDDVAEMKRRGWKADFLQIGIDPLIYKTGIPAIPEYPSVVFTANSYSHFPLSEERNQLVKFLQGELGEKFRPVGNGWTHLHSQWVDQNMEAKVFNSAKIAINLSNYNSTRYTSDRMFRILASGCFCISHHYPGIEKDFTIGQHLETYSNLTDLLGKIQRYLSDEATRNRIAQNGKNLAHSKFTFDHMAGNILKIYNNYKTK